MEKTYDDTNWREDYAKNFCNNKRHLELLENGPHSLSQAWLLGALHNEWKRIKGYKDEHPEDKKIAEIAEDELNHARELKLAMSMV